MSNILDFISTICPITGNDLIDTLLFALITYAAFKAAWILTGDFADSTNSHNSAAMSLLHWTIRIAVFLTLLGIVLGIVHFVRWVSSWQWWGYLVFGLAVAHIVAGVIVAKRLIYRKKQKKQEFANE